MRSRRLVSPQGDILSLSIVDATEGLVFEDISGLDPVNANIVSSSFANGDGDIYQSSRREKRNIVFKLNIDPGYVTTSVVDRRSLLYSFFMPKKRVLLRFYTDSFPVVDIWGRIESFESPLFVKDPKATISIICVDPDFFEEQTILVNGNTVSDTTEMAINYDGSVDTGTTFKLYVNRSLPNFSIYQRTADDTLQTLDFATPDPLIAGDLLEISSNPGAKGAWLTRAGIRTSILYGISPSSPYITFDEGENDIRVYSAGAAIPYTFEYTRKYGGL